MEGHCSKGQSPQRALTPMEEEEEEAEFIFYVFKSIPNLVSNCYVYNFIHKPKFYV